jgi:katanin p80 WD40 repeat-containing subunit B1
MLYSHAQHVLLTERVRTLQVWDLAAGKLLHDFVDHTHPITAVQFNPCDMVLATAATDRTTKFWDLDTFEVIDTCGPETSGARALCFPPDGKSLLAAFPDGLRVYGSEPACTHDYVDVGWTKVVDVALSEGRLYGCSLHTQQ